MRRDFLLPWVITTIVFGSLALLLAGYDSYYDHSVGEGGPAPFGWPVLHPVATVLFFPLRLTQPLFGFLGCAGSMFFFGVYVGLLSVPAAFLWVRLRRSRA